MLTVHKNISAPFVFEAALQDLRSIIIHRIQSHFNKTSFDLAAWLSDNYKGGMQRAEITKHLPQAADQDEWIVLMLAIVPHLQPEFFSSIISEQLPSGGD